MKKQTAILLIALSLFVTVFSGHVIGQNTSEKVKSLKGIKTIRVIIEELKPDFERDVLTKSSIQTDVESKLKIAGMKVIRRDEISHEFLSEGGSTLYINLNTLKINEYSYAYNILVELQQDVMLIRNKEKMYNATTWYTMMIGVGRIQKLSGIRENIKDLVDFFLNDYYKVNSKEKR